MESVRNFFKNDTFAEHLGIELLEVSKGRAKAKMEIKDHHLNGINIAHGGAIRGHILPGRSGVCRCFKFSQNNRPGH